MDRRREYRIGLGADVGLSAKVCGKDNIEITVELVDLTYGGVGILVPPSIQHTLQLGQPISLKFDSKHLDWRISADGRVQNIINLGTLFRIGVQFIDSTKVDRQLTPALRPLFNRRKAYRTMTEILGDTICNWTPLDPSIEVTTYHGHLLDISGTGMAMVIDHKHEALLCPGQRYRTHVDVKQEGIKLDFTLIGQLLYFDKDDKEIRAGFEFEEDDSIFFKDQQSSLFRFVAKLQRRIIKESSDAEIF